MSTRTRSMLVAVYLLACVLLGGSGQGVWRNLGLQLLGVALIAWAAIRPRPSEGEGASPKLGFALLGLGLILVLIQLIPLPAAIWTGLPGRSDIAAAFALSGSPLPALPLSQAPYQSVMSLFAIIPGVALFIAVISLRPSSRWVAVAVVLGMACSIALGAVQVASGQSSWGYLYDHTNRGAVGVFANANHMGTLLLVSIPFATALLTTSRSHRGGSKQGRIALGIAALVLVLVGIALNGSLAALALALPVLLASAALVPAAARWRRAALPIAGLTLVGAVAVLALTPIASAVSDLGTSSSVQSRQQLWGTTVEATGDSFPIGTGLGTFEEVYRQYEDSADVGFQYVNNAHNDYLELALELGLPGILLILLFLAWWAATAVKVWTSPLSSPVGRAATIATAAVLAHSVVDYPLRTAAISAIFGAALAVMAQRPRKAASRKSSELRPTRHVSLG